MIAPIIEGGALSSPIPHTPQTRFGTELFICRAFKLVSVPKFSFSDLLKVPKRLFWGNWETWTLGCDFSRRIDVNFRNVSKHEFCSCPVYAKLIQKSTCTRRKTILKLRMAVCPSDKASIGVKLCQNAFQTIPNISFPDTIISFFSFVWTWKISYAAFLVGLEELGIFACQK